MLALVVSTSAWNSMSGVVAFFVKVNHKERRHRTCVSLQRKAASKQEISVCMSSEFAVPFSKRDMDCLSPVFFYTKNRSRKQMSVSVLVISCGNGKPMRTHSVFTQVSKDPDCGIGHKIHKRIEQEVASSFRVERRRVLSLRITKIFSMSGAGRDLFFK